jgi:hypothetical protein
LQAMRNDHKAKYVAVVLCRGCCEPFKHGHHSSFMIFQKKIFYGTSGRK